MNRRVLVTGGNGFLGKYVVKELLSRGVDVTIMTRSQENIENSIPLISADLRDIESLEKKVRGFDSVYHLAGNIRTSKTDIPELHYAINTEGTLHLLKTCDVNDIRRFIFISTCEVYGDKNREGLSEDEPKEPLNDYAKSKSFAEDYCKTYSERIKMTIIRPSYIYGYGMHPERLFPRLIEQVLSNHYITLSPSLGGNDFVYVKDVAAGIVLLGEKNQKENFEVFNISSGRFCSIIQVFETIKELTGADYKKPNKIEEGKERLSLSIEKAKKQGYLPKYSLREGLKDYLDYYKSNEVV